MKKRILKTVSSVLLLSFTLQLVLPVTAHALSTGPSQPEVQAFEPVGTTEMVDMFSGDFVYNIPLMDVDGYPINISYHGGIGMEQEASWVGLGWSLNPGEINRSVRGVPDDFNGDKILKHLEVEPEKNYMGKVGADFNAEFLGLDFKKLGLSIGADLSMYMNFNNYKGMSAGVRAGVSLALGPSNGNPGSSVGFSPSIGVGSQSGVDLDASLTYSLTKKDKKNDNIQSYKSIGVGSGINSRTGMSRINFTASAGMSEGMYKKTPNGMESQHHSISSGSNESTSVPIGIQNYVPVITNASVLSSYSVQAKLGGEIFGGFPDVYTGFSYSKMRVDQVGDRPAYGYMYLENAPKDRTGILDFIRDKDGIYNKTIKNLPLSSLAYDLYSVSGQGTGGSFRPFRNDIGAIYDPSTGKDNYNTSLGLEFGAGDVLEVGADINFNTNRSECGPWLTSDFSGDNPGTLYEKMFYKQAGELTYNRQLAVNPFYSGTEPLNLTANYPGNPFHDAQNSGQLTFSNGSGTGFINNGLGYAGMSDGRTARANLITTLTSEKATLADFSSEPTVYSYTGHLPGAINLEPITRTASNNSSSNTDLKDRVSYISQSLPDGRRYIYGIPALNNTTEDIVYGASGVNGAPGGDKNATGGLIYVGQGSTPTSSSQNPENYFSRAITPPYAHSYLLTEVLSPDYVDITGDGCTDDDLGGFVKLNYTRWSKDYRWRSPAYDLAAPGNVTAHFDPGYQSDSRDGKAAVSMGSREQWYTHSIESKSLIAEFYTSPREDAKGMPDATLSSAPTTAPNNLSYKLDSIRLFSKNERLQLGANAVPIKTVMFDYDYSLCPNTSNSTAPPNVPGTTTGKGKLTLKRIYTRYGNSDKNLLSPYQFAYNAAPATSPNGQLYLYSYDKKDRWGSTNEGDQQFAGLDPFEFPYTSQKKYPVPNTDPATAFSLSQITLPSGGVIKVEYESDDYAYVQDKRAMEMTKLEGLGKDVNFHAGAALYEGNNQNNFLYFKRNAAREYNHNVTSDDDLRKIYLNDETHLFYSVSTEIRNQSYEQIKGFGEIVHVGMCPPVSGSTDAYGYIELKKVNTSNCDFSPVTLYAMNFAKWNLNQVIYPGYNTNSLSEVLDAFVSAARELGHLRRPLQTFLEQGYCRAVKLDKSFIRLQSPDLCKKGGGIRVKRLTISDKWGAMNSNTPQSDALYGKDYDYTIDDGTYGRISSGVASYEPLLGGDENPLRKPIPYTAAANVALPAIDFYQLEPLGENFYPGGSVGYSSVKVRSIHVDQGKSSMSEEENLFYTAKDYPIRVEATTKNGNSFHEWLVVDQSTLEQASQGYTLYLNDMHGKPKAKNSYVITNYDNNATNPQVVKKRPVNGISYIYNETTDHKLSSSVKAFHLKKGAGQNAQYQYVMEDMELGKESDLVFDSRENYDESESVGAAANLNVLLGAVVPIPFVTVFPSFKKETTVFHSMVGTKVVQQYGILKKVETYEEDAKTTTTENMVYDAESGNVLLSRTNNEFNDNEYAQTLPAYLAYESMGPSYSNIGFKDAPTNLFINKNGDGFMSVNDITNYSEGDELYYEKNSDKGKIWVTKKGTVSLPEYYGYSSISQSRLVFYSATTSAPFQISIFDANGNSYAQSVLALPYGNDPWNLTIAGNYVDLPLGTYKLGIKYLIGPINPVSYVTITINQNNQSPLMIYPISYCSPGTPVKSLQMPQDNGSESPQYCNISTGPFCGNCIQLSKCFLKVNARYKNKHPNGSTINSNWWTSNLPKTGFSTEIVRSGRRNMLGNNIQSLITTVQPNIATGNLSDFLTGSGLITISNQTYTDAAVPYENFDRSLVPVNGSGNGNNTSIFEGLNDYVLGLKGNFRPKEQYTAFADRSYTANNTHSRRDGTFSIAAGGLFWQQGSTTNCEPWNLLFNTSSLNLNVWKKATEVTKYDMFGNAIEEVDALNIYSTAQYGYGKKLPVAVASNARQQSIMFDGFEDMHGQVIPDVLVKMFHSFTTLVNLGGNAGAARPASGYFQSPFGKFFDYITTAINPTAASSPFLQSYSVAGYQSQSATIISSGQNNGYAHSGNRMLSVSGSWSLPLPVKSSYSTASIESFALLNNNDYLVDVWVKRPTAAVPQINVQLNNANYPLAPKGVPIEGWQLMEAKLALSSLTPSPTTASINFGGAMIVDDVRIMPLVSNMKSFVYDTQHNDRLSAELDANHYATFYEYDQEGQLVRVKKETEKGIVTVSENRKSLKK